MALSVAISGMALPSVTLADTVQTSGVALSFIFVFQFFPFYLIFGLVLDLDFGMFFGPGFNFGLTFSQIKAHHYMCTHSHNIVNFQGYS